MSGRRQQQSILSFFTPGSKPPSSASTPSPRNPVESAEAFARKDTSTDQKRKLKFSAVAATPKTSPQSNSGKIDLSDEEDQLLRTSQKRRLVRRRDLDEDEDDGECTNSAGKQAGGGKMDDGFCTPVPVFRKPTAGKEETEDQSEAANGPSVNKPLDFTSPKPQAQYSKNVGPESLEVFVYQPQDPSVMKSPRPFVTPKRPALAELNGSDAKKSKTQQFSEKNQDRYKWLEDIQDASGKRPDDPDYDPSTLWVPNEAWNKFSEFEKQFWEVKREHFDKIVFFKKGKFYELYETDADVGHKELDLKLTDRVNMRMVGVPEASFHAWATKLIVRGYKVVRVEQMEKLSHMTKKKIDSSGKKTDNAGKVCRREVCAVLTKGTLTDEEMIGSGSSNFLLSLREESSERKFGLCILEASLGAFYLGSIDDDAALTHLETALLRIRPAEIVSEKGSLSEPVRRLIKRSAGTAIFSTMRGGELWDPDSGTRLIAEGGYFRQSKQDKEDEEEEEDEKKEIDDASNQARWPAVLRTAIQNPIKMSAFVGCLNYLKQLKLDADLVSMSNFHEYQAEAFRSSMMLDGKAVTNLELLENVDNGSPTGTLLKLLDYCVTPFGKRLLRKWICHPLRIVSEIEDRLNAIDDLREMPTLVGEVRDRLKSVVDIERALSRIHANARSTSTAVMFDTQNHKITHLCQTLAGLRTIFEVVNSFEPHLDSIRSNCLRYTLTKGEGFPAMAELLTSFDQGYKFENGVIRPVRRGLDEEFDEASRKVDELEKKLSNYLDDQRKYFSCSDIIYKDIGKEKYQMEVPETVVKRKGIPGDFIEKSATKGKKRYWSAKILKILPDLEEARERKEQAINSLVKRLQQKFDQHYPIWMQATQAIAQLDCLVSLTTVSLYLSGPSCRPILVPPSEGPVLELRQCWHPCITLSSGSQFIPNDVQIGGPNATFVLVTGPNMGGKSTLLRQTCIAVIMAQLGTYVPAEYCRLSPVDRVFTRIGARDNILLGESTFMVELQETVNILKHATQDSLIILDELGRGTSTFDGFSIAYGVTEHLASVIKARTLFSTHYHMLTEDFGQHRNVALYHMASQLDDSTKRVTFLYKFTKGFCPKSYGLNVARLAALPLEVIERAEGLGDDFERETFRRCQRARLRSLAPPSQQEQTFKRLYGVALSSDVRTVRKALLSV